VAGREVTRINGGGSKEKRPRRLEERVVGKGELRAEYLMTGWISRHLTPLTPAIGSRRTQKARPEREQVEREALLLMRWPKISRRSKGEGKRKRGRGFCAPFPSDKGGLSSTRLAGSLPVLPLPSRYLLSSLGQWNWGLRGECQTCPRAKIGRGKRPKRTLPR